MKQEPLDNALLLGEFAEFIAERWLSGYPRTYPITRHRAWNSWRARHGGQSIPWRCDSLSQAAQHWCWTESETEPSFSDLANRLQAAIATRDESEAEQLCYRIYRWGGVDRKPGDHSHIWVRKAAEAGRLSTDLEEAVALLSPSCTRPLDRFNANDLPMTSATTKLFAAAAIDGRVAIYDSRVGAGLGLLAKQFLEARGIDGVPEVLHFRWGAAQSPAQNAARTRDPSGANHVFLALPTGPYAHRPRADLSRRTNVLFQAVIERLAARAVTATVLELERALFMIGYRVR
jgi:hypothetical protein